MSNKPLGLTRNQLAEFLPNARAIRAFEQLLKQVGDLLPSDVVTLNRLITEAYLEASSASANSVQALDTLVSISRSLELIASAPPATPVVDAGDMTPPVRLPNVSELPDMSVKLPVAGSLLIYNATLKLWQSAVITQGSNVTITNADGSVTVAGNSQAVEVHAATSKATPVDADELPLADSAASFALKKFTWANLKATLATWLNATLIPAAFTTLTAKGGGVIATLTDWNTLAAFQVSLANPAVRFGVGYTAADQIELQGYDTSNNAKEVHINRLGGSVFLAGEKVVASATGLAITGSVTTSSTTLHVTSAALTNGAGVALGTLTNAPAAGNPTKWVPINDNGTTRYIPTW